MARLWRYAQIQENCRVRWTEGWIEPGITDDDRGTADTLSAAVRSQNRETIAESCGPVRRTTAVKCVVVLPVWIRHRRRLCALAATKRLDRRRLEHFADAKADRDARVLRYPVEAFLYDLDQCDARGLLSRAALLQ